MGKPGKEQEAKSRVKDRDGEVCCASIRFSWWSHYLVLPCLVSNSSLSFPFSWFFPPCYCLVRILVCFCYSWAIFTFFFCFPFRLAPALWRLVGLSPIGSGALDDECRVTNSIDSGMVPPKASRVQCEYFLRDLFDQTIVYGERTASRCETPSPTSSLSLLGWLPTQ